jgi:hypothetical protein
MHTSKLGALLSLILIVGGGTGCSTPGHVKDAGLYHRFWRGYQRRDLKQGEFQYRLNSEFFPLFPASVPYGLVSYLPVLPVRSRFGGPDEWALVSYQSIAHHDRFKQSAPGKAAADAHWNVFARNVSFSTVVERFDGHTQPDHAYVTNPGFGDYAGSKVVFAIYDLLPGQRREEEIAANIARNHGAPASLLRNIVFLVTKEQLAEYLFFPSDADPTALLPSLGADQVITLRDGVPGQEKIHEGQGLKSRL